VVEESGRLTEVHVLLQDTQKRWPPRKKRSSLPLLITSSGIATLTMARQRQAALASAAAATASAETSWRKTWQHRLKRNQEPLVVATQQESGRVASEFGINPRQVKISTGETEVAVFTPKEMWDDLTPDAQSRIRQQLIEKFNVQNRPDFKANLYQELPLDKIALGWPDPHTNIPPGSIIFYTTGETPFFTNWQVSLPGEVIQGQP
jgi:hypothetical protein